MEKYYTVDDVAEMTGLTSRTIRTYIADGRLTGLRLGKQWRFSEADIAKLYRTPGADDEQRKDEVAEAASAFNTERHNSLSACIIVDCADLSDDALDDLEKRLRSNAAAQLPSERPEIVRTGSRFAFTGAADQTAKLLKLVRKG